MESDFRRHKLETRRTHLYAEWNTRTEKIAKLRQALILETDAAVKFQLEKQIQAEQQEIELLENELSEIERDLQSGPELPIAQPSSQSGGDRPTPSPPPIVPPSQRPPTSSRAISNVSDRRSVTPQWTRQQFLKWLGLGGIGMVGTAAISQLLKEPSPQPSPAISPSPTQTPSPQSSPSASPPIQPSPSAVAVSYTKLEELLKANQWKEADQETKAVMLKIAGREQEGYLDTESIQNFPCEALQTIDRLWAENSGERFGFSVQRMIYVDVGGKLDGKSFDGAVWHKFGDQVGWRKQDKWVAYNQLDFSSGAPAGQFPFGGSPRFAQSWLLLGVGGGLLSRIETCEV